MMPGTVRVAHLIHSLARGGAEAVLVDLARVAPAAGLELAVVPIVRTDTGHGSELRHNGVAVFDLDLRSRWDPRAFGRALERLRAWQPDVVHTHLKHADLVGAVAARKLRRPQVSTLHIVDDQPDLLSRVKRRAASVARVSTAARTIAVSEAQRQWYLSAFPKADPRRVTTIHNGVCDRPVLDRLAARQALGVPATALVVLQIGLLREGKGHRELLAAVDELRRDGDLSGLSVLLAGDGPLRAELEDAAGPEVRFLGYREDVPTLLGAADIVVQPSLFDALPTSLIEALAAGRPAVATAVGGIPEIITSDCGIVVPPGSPHELARAIRELGRDAERRAVLGAAARTRYEQSFDASRWADHLCSLYRELAGAPGLSP